MTEERSQRREVSGGRTGAGGKNLNSSGSRSGAEPDLPSSLYLREAETREGRAAISKGKSLDPFILKGHWSFLGKEWGILCHHFQELSEGLSRTKCTGKANEG